MFEFDKDDLIKAIKDFKKKHKQWAKLDSIIRPFISDNLSQKKSIELCQVGKFITLLNKPSHIIKYSDSPDFIISYNGEEIGLEHERILNKDEVKKTKSISKLFDDAAEVFKLNYPDQKVLANCWLNTETFNFKKNESDKLKNEISEYVYSVLINDTSFDKPKYIDSIRLMKHTNVSFSYNPGGYIVKNLDKVTLENAISKKEPLVNKYKSNSSLKKQWLLIVIGSISPDSYEFQENQFQLDIKTNFDKVFLMEDFNEKVWQIL